MLCIYIERQKMNCYLKAQNNYRRKRYATDEEYKKIRLDRSRKYYQKNRQKILEQKRKRYKERKTDTDKSETEEKNSL